MLYIIATPIGNLKDITFRAIETLKEVDVVLCEDTRQTKKLLDHYEIKKKMISLHQHSAEEKIRKLLQDYDIIAYVSDAGTPGISDPGNKLVAMAVEMKIEVSPIPGPSAVITALSVSGLPTDKFEFLGFLPKKGRQKVFDKIKNTDKTIAFYESPHRILKTLMELSSLLDSSRRVVVARELTKKFESIYRGTIDDVINQVKDKPTYAKASAGRQKGEFVVIIEKVTRNG